MTRGTALGGEQRSGGLGLFIVKDIVRAHRGRIAVTSSPDAGTVFRAAFSRVNRRHWAGNFNLTVVRACYRLLR
jgi:sigma-B regulation protein RsbU (phosphoserine phosphatase)